MNGKSREDVEKLKKNWKLDPCWDIETEPGFEHYRGELKAFREKCEAEWKAAQQREHDHMASKICPMSMAFVNRNPDDTGFGYDTCQVEKCAWWDKAENCCAIRALAIRG